MCFGFLLFLFCNNVCVCVCLYMHECVVSSIVLGVVYVDNMLMFLLLLCVCVLERRRVSTG